MSSTRSTVPGDPTVQYSSSPGKNRLRKRDLTRTYSRAQFAAKLRRLADAIETGKGFTIQVAGEKLAIPADVTFTIEHERSGRDEELEFQLLWNRK